jgi:pimeloyl-ACP methyl ester carboxylesterase
MATLYVDGADLYYELQTPANPSQKLVLLVNGYLRTSQDLRMFARHLVGSGFAVLTFDNRGVGQTAYSRPFTLSDMVNDCTQLLDSVPHTQTFAAGISMGGIIVQELSRIRRLTAQALVSTAATPRDLNVDEGRWSSDVTAVAQRLERYFSQNFYAANKPLVAAMAKTMAKGFENPALVRGGELQRQAIAGFVEQTEPDTTTPTLIVHGTEDNVIPFGATSRLQSQFRRSALLPLMDKGHLLLAEAPKELYAAVSDFFARQN